MIAQRRMFAGLGFLGHKHRLHSSTVVSSSPASLVLEHESFGIVEQVGPQETRLATGDYIVRLVRHPGDSWYDHIGMPNMSTDGKYYEQGISLRHGFLTEYHADTPEQLARLRSRRPLADD